MGSLLPPPGERPCFAQVYMFDSIQEQLQFRHETHPNLDLDVLQLLSTVLREVNPYAVFSISNNRIKSPLFVFVPIQAKAYSNKRLAEVLTVFDYSSIRGEK